MPHRNALSMSADALYLQGGEMMMLVHPDYNDRVAAESFRPTFWGTRARPVDHGGRGAAWFIDTGRPGWMLRNYQRGGWMANLDIDVHWYRGKDAVRSFAEFQLLFYLHRLGLPVPRPVAAGYQRVGGLWYRAQIIVERVPEAIPFSSRLHDPDPELWEAVGRHVRRFHDWGVYHADLNCHNILISGNDLYLIDFDKSCIRAGNRWKAGNLKRLRRSINKILPDMDTSDVDRCWQSLLRGYGDNDRPDRMLNMLASVGLLPLVGTVADFNWLLLT